METGPKKAPDYAQHRDAVASADTIANVPKTQGINCSNYQYAHVQVIPSGGANPTVVVYFWSEHADAWVEDQSDITKAGVGANTPYEFTVECRGRRMFVAVSVIAAGVCDVYVSGFELTHPS